MAVWNVRRRKVEVSLPLWPGLTLRIESDSNGHSDA